MNSLTTADVIEVESHFPTPWQTVELSSPAGERALAGGTEYQAIEMVKAFRKTNTTTPVLVMGYLNPIEIIGLTSLSAFVKMQRLTVFWWSIYRRQEAGDFTQNRQFRDERNLLRQPPPERREQVLKHGGGFIYYVSVKGVDRLKSIDAQDVGEHVQAIKAQTALPVCVGFWYSWWCISKAVGQYADGVIVGSELVKNFADGTMMNKKSPMPKSHLR